MNDSIEPTTPQTFNPSVLLRTLVAEAWLELLRTSMTAAEPDPGEQDRADM